VQIGPKSDQNCDLWAGSENGKKRKSQNRYISPPCGGAISQPIYTKFDAFVDLSDVITPAKFGFKIFSGFFRPRGGIKHVPFRKQTAYNSTISYRTAL